MPRRQTVTSEGLCAPLVPTVNFGTFPAVELVTLPYLPMNIEARRLAWEVLSRRRTRPPFLRDWLGLGLAIADSECVLRRGRGRSGSNRCRPVSPAHLPLPALRVASHESYG